MTTLYWARYVFLLLVLAVVFYFVVVSRSEEDR